MILGAISLLDCLAFVVFLAPQLLIQVGLIKTIKVALQTIPFLVLGLPAQLVHERYIKPKYLRSPFCQNATLFQDVVIRCVRYAFAYIDARVGRVFLSKSVAHPFFRFRLLRHGYLKCPVHYEDIERHGVKGVWITQDLSSKPDIIIYYCHGGGFSMASSYFYLEFLIAWTTCLKRQGFRNPSLFALEYSLVPDAAWPVQFNEVRDGYRFLLDSFGERAGSKICVSGDSAGATLMLSMLLHPGRLEKEPQFDNVERPGLAILISPWTHLISDLNINTASDYLDKDSLQLYAEQYAGEEAQINPIVSPGLSRGRWSKASPRAGYRITFGSEEVFAPGVQEVSRQMKNDGAHVVAKAHPAGIHAWPVVSLFLGSNRAERLQGLDVLTEFVMSSNIIPAGNRMWLKQ